MPLFSRNSVSFRDGVSDSDSDRFKHLEKMIVAGKAVGRAPELAGTTVVFLPYPNFSNPNYAKELDVVPDRLSDDPRDYGRWLFYADGVSKFGRNALTILFDDPDDSGFVPSEHNPVHMIHDAVDRAIHAGQVIETPFGTSDSDRWEILLKGDRKNKVYPVLSNPGQLVMAYALIYSSGKKSYIMEGAPFGAPPADLPVVFVMSSYASVRSMSPQLDAVGADGKLKYPLITGQKFVHFYDRQKNDCPAMRNESMAVTSALGGVRRAVQATGAEGAGTQLAGYGVHVTDTYTGRPDDPKLIRKDVIRLACQKLKPWEETLRGHSPEKAAELVASYCGLPLSILWYAWKSMPSYYTDEMKTKARAPKSVNFGGSSTAMGPVSSLGIPTDPTDPIDDPVDTPVGDAPWGGNIGDPPGASGQDDGEASDAAYAADIAVAQQKLREHMAKTADSASAGRSQATRPPGGK